MWWEGRECYFLWICWCFRDLHWHITLGFAGKGKCLMANMADMLDFLSTTSVLSWSSRTWRRWRTRVLFLWYWCGDKNDKIMCPVSAIRWESTKQQFLYHSALKKIIFSILANNSLFCVGFHLSVIIKMRELEYFWLTFTLWTFKIASPPKTKLKLNQDIEINDNAKTEAILTGCDSNDKFDLVV